MNQGRVFGAPLESGYCPQAHNSSSGNQQNDFCTAGRNKKQRPSHLKCAKSLSLVKVNMIEERAANGVQFFY